MYIVKQIGKNRYFKNGTWGTHPKIRYAKKKADARIFISKYEAEITADRLNDFFVKEL